MLLELIFSALSTISFAQDLAKAPPACDGGYSMNWVKDIQHCSYEQLIELQNKIYSLQEEQSQLRDKLKQLRHQAKIDGLNMVQIEIGGAIGASLGITGLLSQSSFVYSKAPKKWAYPLMTIGLGIVIMSEIQTFNLRLAHPEFNYFESVIYHLGEEIKLKNQVIELSLQLKKINK